jgi:hypothetical protein
MLLRLLIVYLHGLTLCTGYTMQQSVYRVALVKVPIAKVTKLYRSSVSTSLYSSEEPNEADPTEKSIDSKSNSVVEKVKRWFTGSKDDGLTAKERLAKMGLSALLSYGWVSNMSYAISVSLAWFTFTKQYGISPLAPGQWKKFLVVYSGFFIFNNAVRPIRFGLSVAVSRYFDNFVNYIQRKTKVRKSVAIGIVVFLANICGTFGAMALGISVASAASGVAIFPSRLI